MFGRITLVNWSRQGGQARVLKPGAVIGGLLWALTSTVFICAALVLWVVLTAGQAYHFSGIFTAGTILGALLGGAVSGKMAGNQGWLHGLTMGLLYGLIMMSFLAAWDGGLTNLPGLAARSLGMLALAVLGGVAGVNLATFKR